MFFGVRLNCTCILNIYTWRVHAMTLLFNNQTTEFFFLQQSFYWTRRFDSETRAFFEENQQRSRTVHTAIEQLRNTTDFLEKLEDVTIEEDELIEHAADDGVKERTGMGTEAILRLLKLCTSITNFKFWKQHYALAIGLPRAHLHHQWLLINNIYTFWVFERKPRHCQHSLISGPYPRGSRVLE